MTDRPLRKQGRPPKNRASHQVAIEQTPFSSTDVQVCKNEQWILKISYLQLWFIKGGSHSFISSNIHYHASLWNRFPPLPQCICNIIPRGWSSSIFCLGSHTVGAISKMKWVLIPIFFNGGGGWELWQHQLWLILWLHVQQKWPFTHFAIKILVYLDGDLGCGGGGWMGS